jgi:hypothetical protein
VTDGPTNRKVRVEIFHFPILPKSTVRVPVRRKMVDKDKLNQNHFLMNATMLNLKTDAFKGLTMLESTSNVYRLDAEFGQRHVTDRVFGGPLILAHDQSRAMIGCCGSARSTLDSWAHDTCQFIHMDAITLLVYARPVISCSRPPTRLPLQS